MDSFPGTMKTMLAALVALSFAAGCDSEVTPAGGGGEGPEGGSGGNGGNGIGGGNGGNGVGGGSDECEQYLQQEGPPVQTVPISVRNATENPIYLGVPKANCSVAPLYRAETPAGEPVQTELSVCEQTCSSFAQSSCGCAAECAEPQVLLIYPGGVADLSWTAVVYQPEDMPAVCYFDESCVQATCVSPTQPPTQLNFLVDGYPELGDCSEAICDCDGGEIGSCIVEGAKLVAGTPVVASGEWSQSVESIGITFQ